MTDSIEQREREQFEEFVKRELGDVPVMDNGRYVSMKINNYWRTWQARAALSAPQAGVPEGCQVVPKTLTGDMLDAGHEAGLISFTELREIWSAMLEAAPPAPVQAVVPASPWMPIDTAPKDGYVILRFPGPFLDTECPGVAVGRRLTNRSGESVGWWLTAIWASATAFKEPDGWMPLPPAPGAPAQVPAPGDSGAAVSLAPSRVGRVYLAGPMTGIPEFNFPAFNAAAAELRRRGLSVVNPAEHGIVDGAEPGDYLRYDISKLVTCESVALLPGWSKSKGACFEVQVAQFFGMPLRFLDGAEPVPAEPSKAAPVLLSEEDVFYNDDIISINGEFSQLAMSEFMENVVRPIESAVLRANGIGGE